MQVCLSEMVPIKGCLVLTLILSNLRITCNMFVCISPHQVVGPSVASSEPLTLPLMSTPISGQSTSGKSGLKRVSS